MKKIKLKNCSKVNESYFKKTVSYTCAQLSSSVNGSNYINRCICSMSFSRTQFKSNAHPYIRNAGAHIHIHTQLCKATYTNGYSYNCIGLMYFVYSLLLPPLIGSWAFRSLSYLSFWVWDRDSCWLAHTIQLHVLVHTACMWTFTLCLWESYLCC